LVRMTLRENRERRGSHGRRGFARRSMRRMVTDAVVVVAALGSRLVGIEDGKEGEMRWKKLERCHC
jgi:hypothetical protein